MTIRLPKGVLIGLGVLLVAGAAFVAGVLLFGGGDDGPDKPPPINVRAQAGTSYRALTEMVVSQTDAQCYETLDYTYRRDAACAEHWAADSQSAASESSIWNKALLEHRVPVNYLDVAHAFKDVSLEASHVFDDLRYAVQYQNLADYTHALEEYDDLNQLKSELDATLRAAGINPETLISSPTEAGGVSQ